MGKATNWATVKVFLEDPALRNGVYRKALTRVMRERMQKRKGVNITKCVRNATRVLGTECGIWASELLWETARETGIRIVDEEVKALD